jgi:hypothetical protein
MRAYMGALFSRRKAKTLACKEKSCRGLPNFSKEQQTRVSGTQSYCHVAEDGKSCVHSHIPSIFASVGRPGKLHTGHTSANMHVHVCNLVPEPKAGTLQQAQPTEAAVGVSFQRMAPGIIANQPSSGAKMCAADCIHRQTGRICAKAGAYHLAWNLRRSWAVGRAGSVSLCIFPLP